MLKDEIVSPEYKINTYTVTFVDNEGQELAEKSVDYGGNTIAPVAPVLEGHDFIGWSNSFDDVREDLIITPEYEIKTYTVSFVSSNGDELGSSSVKHGGDVIAPNTSNMVNSKYFEFSWDKPLNSVVKDMKVVGVVDLKSAYKDINYVGTIDVSTPYELQAINNDTVSRGKNYTQTRDIDLSVIDDFVPITVFTGSFNGGGYVIDNLTINQPSEKGMGLFGWSRGAEIKNVGLTNVNVKGSNAVGGLVGLCIDTNISNSYSEGSVSGESIYIGGLVGGLIDNATINNSYARGNVKGSSETGGLVGVIEPDGGSIVNSFSQSRVDVDASRHGGLVGANYHTNIRDSGWDSDLCVKGLGWDDNNIDVLVNTKGYSTSDMNRIIDRLIK